MLEVFEGLEEISNMSIWEQLIYYVQQNGSYLWDQFVRHLLVSVYGVLFAAIIAIPLGFYIARHAQLAKWVVSIANVLQTIPSLAMLALLMIGLGIGVNTVIITVFLYSILPIIKNTYAGVISVDNSLLDAAKGMGMTRRQLTFKVELPM